MIRDHTTQMSKEIFKSIKTYSISYAFIVTAIVFGFSSVTSNLAFSQGATESDSSIGEEVSKSPITLINEIKSLMTQVNASYVNQNYVLAEELATTAYLDHYEFLEAPLYQKDPILMEATEILIREDLINSIKNRTGTVVVQQLINTINSNLDKAVVLFQ